MGREVADSDAALLGTLQEGSLVDIRLSFLTEFAETWKLLLEKQLVPLSIFLHCLAHAYLGEVSFVIL